MKHWLYILCLAVSANTMHAMNYWSPYNIINAGADWFFRVKDNKNEKLQLIGQHQAMKAEFLAWVNQNVDTYHSNLKNTPADVEKHTQNMLAKGQEQLQQTLDAIPLAQIQPDLITLDQLPPLLAQTPEQLFGASNEGEQPIGGSRPTLQEIQRRAAVDDRFAALNAGLNALATQSDVTDHDTALIAQARAHVKQAYDSVLTSQNLRLWPLT